MVIDDLMVKVSPEPNSGCWLWLGPVQSRGYGTIWVKEEKWKKWLVHKLIYELTIGPVPKGLELDHLCKITCCVNPRHLEPITHQENVQRGPTRGKGKIRRR